LQEEAYKVIVEIAVTQGKVKQVAQEIAENLKTHLTIEMVEENVQHEA
jgi:predicted transcriptional regulator